MKELLNVKLISNELIPSVNNIYEHVRGRVIKKNEVIRYQDGIMKELAKNNIDRTLLRGTGFLKTTIIFILKRSLLKRDLDNMLKMTNDAVFKYFNHNDVVIMHSEERKFINPNSDFEAIFYKIEQMDEKSVNEFNLNTHLVNEES